MIESREELAASWNRGRTPILAPRRLLIDDERTAADPLPRTWENTTDSIAARIAEILRADRLVLLKSTGAPPGLTTQGAAELGVVDRVFPRAARAIPEVVLVNLREPKMPRWWLETRPLLG